MIYPITYNEDMVNALKKYEESKLKEGDIIDFEGTKLKITCIDKEGITFSNKLT